MAGAGEGMAQIDLPYVKRYRDRAGVWRHYFRRRKRNCGALPGLPGSPEFMEAYSAFLDSKPEPTGKTPGTFGHVITKYYASVNFTNLKASSKQGYRYVLEPLAKEHGHKPVALLTDDDVRDIIEEIGKRAPQMANLTKRVLRNVLIIAHERKWIPRPVTGGKIVPYKGGKHRAWTQDELDIYEARWPLGTRERLAYATYLYTDQRGGDVVRMRRSDVAKGGNTGYPREDRCRRWAPDSSRAVGGHQGLPIERIDYSGRSSSRAANQASCFDGAGHEGARTCRLAAGL
jgi:hypothetical protein